MFGLKHCVYFSCLMQGSMHDEEAEKKPLFLCPVCFRKLHSNMGFSIIKRYEGLMTSCEIQTNKHLNKFKLWYQSIVKELKLLGEPDPVIGKSSSQSKLSAVKQTVPKKGKAKE